MAGDVPWNRRLLRDCALPECLEEVGAMISRDKEYEILAGKLGYETFEISTLAVKARQSEYSCVGRYLLEDWKKRPRSTVLVLQTMLQEMQRDDAVQALEKHLKDPMCRLIIEFDNKICLTPRVEESMTLEEVKDHLVATNDELRLYEADQKFEYVGDKRDLQKPAKSFKGQHLHFKLKTLQRSATAKVKPAAARYKQPSRKAASEISSNTQRRAIRVPSRHAPLDIGDHGDTRPGEQQHPPEHEALDTCGNQTNDPHEPYAAHATQCSEDNSTEFDLRSDGNHGNIHGDIGRGDTDFSVDLLSSEGERNREQERLAEAAGQGLHAVRTRREDRNPQIGTKDSGETQCKRLGRQFHPEFDPSSGGLPSNIGEQDTDSSVVGNSYGNIRPRNTGSSLNRNHLDPRTAPSARPGTSAMDSARRLPEFHAGAVDPDRMQALFDSHRNESGSYILRISASRPGLVCITSLHNDNGRNKMTSRYVEESLDDESRTVMSLEEDAQFSSLDDLLKYYRTHSIAPDCRDLTLARPIPCLATGGDMCVCRSL